MDRRSFIKTIAGTTACAFVLAKTARGDDSEYVQYCADHGININGGEYNISKTITFGANTHVVFRNAQFNMHKGAVFYFDEAHGTYFRDNKLMSYILPGFEPIPSIWQVSPSR